MNLKLLLHSIFFTIGVASVFSFGTGSNNTKESPIILSSQKSLLESAIQQNPAIESALHSINPTIM